MNLGFEKDCFIGVVFDIHDFTYNKDSGLKFLKNSMIKLLSGLDKGHKVFVAGNQNLPKTHGESISQLSQFSLDDKTNVNKMLRDALEGIGTQNNCNKYIFVFTNKFNPKQSYLYKNIIELNEKRDYQCIFHIFEFGKLTHELQNVVDHKGQYHNIIDMNYFLELLQELQKEIKNG